jgi:hypothetical protein
MNNNYSQNLNPQQKSHEQGKGMPQEPGKGKGKEGGKTINPSNPSRGGNVPGKSEKWSK